MDGVYKLRRRSFAQIANLVDSRDQLIHVSIDKVKDFLCDTRSRKGNFFLITHFPPRIWYGTKSEHPVVFQEVCDVEECGSVGVEFGAVS